MNLSVSVQQILFSSGNDYENSKKIADRFLEKAYGSSLLFSDGGGKDCVWFRRWSSIVSLRSFQYNLPNGVQLGEIL